MTPEAFVKQAFTLHGARFVNLIPKMWWCLIICYSKCAGTILKFNGAERLMEVSLSHTRLLTSYLVVVLVINADSRWQSSV